MTKDEAIKYLQQIYPNGGHCWLDEQRIEAIGMAIKALQEEPKVKFKVGDVILMVNDDCGIGFQTIKKIYCDGYLTAEMLKIKFEEQGQWELAEEPTKKDYHERYKRIAQSEQFKKSYEGMSIGEVIPIEGEDSANIDFEKELYKQFGQVKDFTLGIQIAKRFYEMGRQHKEPVSQKEKLMKLSDGKLHLGWLDDANEIEIEEPVSDGLEEAAKLYVSDSLCITGEEDWDDAAIEALNAYKAGAKWQKGHLWKPSAEQLHYLSWVANIKLGDGVVEQEVSNHLNELLEDLKKVK